MKLRSSDRMTGRIQEGFRNSGVEEIRRLETKCVAAIMGNPVFVKPVGGHASECTSQILRSDPDFCGEKRFFSYAVKNERKKIP